MTYAPNHTRNIDPAQRDEPLLVPFAEACRLFGCGRTKGYELIESGAWVARKLGARTLVETASIRSLAASLPRVAAKAAA